jgi:hypothetical protein
MKDASKNKADREGRDERKFFICCVSGRTRAESAIKSRKSAWADVSYSCAHAHAHAHAHAYAHEYAHAHARVYIAVHGRFASHLDAHVRARASPKLPTLPLQIRNSALRFCQECANPCQSVPLRPSAPRLLPPILNDIPSRVDLHLNGASSAASTVFALLVIASFALPPVRALSILIPYARTHKASGNIWLVSVGRPLFFSRINRKDKLYIKT